MGNIHLIFESVRAVFLLFPIGTILLNVWFFGPDVLVECVEGMLSVGVKRKFGLRKVVCLKI